MAKRNEKNGLVWYSFSVFEPFPELVHGAMARFGGTCEPDGALHLAFNDRLPHEQVRTNIRRVEEALGLPGLALVRQTHSANVTVVRPQDDYHPQGPDEIRQDCDAMIAPEPGVGLLIRLADCQGIILYDPRTGVLGLVHSGWRGSVRNILGATVDLMAEHGAAPADIRAGISPSLGPCCAEFVNYRQELPESFQEFMIRPNHFDFWAISRKQLTDKGLAPNNIEAAGICTKCSAEFFSYRRGDWGRFGVAAGVIR
ncbi:polyphenol oxidase family protein [Deltaproteobacteria bacterium OttesenSCG-928-K17]|nr:polyphenol oxidase family protein [Deltaproteobacteria bacterium OttesenSCG-928-K17]